MVYKSFDKKSKGGGVNIEIKLSKQLAEQLHKPIIRKFKKITAYSGYKDNISGVGLADMQLISKFNRIQVFIVCY